MKKRELGWLKILVGTAAPAAAAAAHKKEEEDNEIISPFCVFSSLTRSLARCIGDYIKPLEKYIKTEKNNKTQKWKLH